MMGFGDGYGWWLGFGWVFMILFWALVIAGILALVRWLALTSSPRSDAGGKSALDILKERYAKGELTREQFEQMRRDLES